MALVIFVFDQSGWSDSKAFMSTPTNIYAATIKEEQTNMQYQGDIPAAANAPFTHRNAQSRNEAMRAKNQNRRSNASQHSSSQAVNLPSPRDRQVTHDNPQPRMGRKFTLYRYPHKCDENVPTAFCACQQDWIGVDDGAIYDRKLDTGELSTGDFDFHGQACEDYIYPSSPSNDACCCIVCDENDAPIDLYYCDGLSMVLLVGRVDKLLSNHTQEPPQERVQGVRGRGHVSA